MRWCAATFPRRTSGKALCRRQCAEPWAPKKRRPKGAVFHHGSTRQVQCTVAVTGFADPDDTLIVKSPCAVVAPVVVLGMLTVIWPAAEVAVMGPPVPGFVEAGD